MPSPSYTIGSDVGDDFTTLGLALSDAGVRADATSTVELLLRNESHSNGTGVNVINDATFACNDLVIKPMAGAVQDGIIGSTAKPILVCDAADNIRWKDDGTTLTVQDIEFDHNADQFNSSGTLGLDSTSAILIQRCMFHNASNSTSRYCIQSYVGSTNDVIRNCLFFNIVNTALTTNMLYSRGTGVLWQNLTAYVDDSASSGGSLRLFRHQTGTSTIQNCVLSTSTASPTYVTPFSAVSTSSSNVSSQSGVTGVTQEVAATTFDSLTGTTPLRIKAGSAAVSAGTDLSGSFTDDLIGRERGLWDLGAIRTRRELLIDANGYAIGDVGSGFYQYARMGAPAGGDITFDLDVHLQATTGQNAGLWIRSDEDVETGTGVVFELSNANLTDVVLEVRRDAAGVGAATHVTSQTISTDGTAHLSLSITGNNYTLDAGPISNPTLNNFTWTDAVANEDGAWLWSNSSDIGFDNFAAVGLAPAPSGISATAAALLPSLEASSSVETDISATAATLLPSLEASSSVQVSSALEVTGTCDITSASFGELSIVGMCIDGEALITSVSAGELSLVETGGLLIATGVSAGFQNMNGGING